ncbi:MAG: PQQ-binding-like beta-propeller repeat protein, partial [Candidatus Thermoplasmatota archaeon]|nr:PQQ-binding-like beta-propeller repeat protein [Candidatus Thermoplasmatota archaeon]
MRPASATWSFRENISPSALSVALDGKYSAVGTPNGLIFLNSRGILLWYNKKIRKIKDVSVSTISGKIAVGSSQKVLYLVNLKGESLWHRELDSSVLAVSISSRGNLIAVGTEEGRLMLFDGKGKKKWEVHLSNSDFSVNSVDITSDGEFILAGTDYSHLYLYDSKGNVLWSKETGSEVLRTCISSNGDYLGYLTSDRRFSFCVKNSRMLWENTFDSQPLWIDMAQTADFVSVGESPNKVNLYNKSGKKVWGFVNENSRIGVMASGGGNVILGNKGGVFNYSLEPYLKRLLLSCQRSIAKASDQNLDTTLAKKTFAEASKNFSSSNYLKFLVNIQKARNFAREARVIESNESPSERRLERNEMDESNDLSQEKSDDELMSKLVQLAEMREKGVLSEEEFIMAKSKLLQL